MRRTSNLAMRAIGLLVVIGLAFVVLLVSQTPEDGRPGNATEHAGQITTSGEQVTITFTDNEALASSYDVIIAEFHEAYPNITVQFVPRAGSTTFDIAGTAQQVARADTGLLPDFYLAPESAAYFSDLSSLIDIDSRFDASDFWPGLIDGCRTENNLVGLPLSAQLSLIYYDPAVFDAAGVPYPQPGWTIDQLQLAARTLTQREGDQVTRYGLLSSSPLGLLTPYIKTSLAQSDTLDAAQLANTLEWYVDLVNADVTPHPNETSRPEWSSEYFSLIDQNRAAMWLGQSSDLHTWARAGVAPFPTDTSTQRISPAQMTCIVMSAGTQHPNEAWQWINFLSTRMIAARSGIPARQSVAEANGYWSTLPENTELILRFALEHGAYNNINFNTLTAIEEALTSSLRDGTDLEIALAQIDSSDTTVPTPAPIAVNPPQPTSVPGEAVTIDYFDFGLHPGPPIGSFGGTSPLRTLIDDFQRTHPNISIRQSSVISFIGEPDWYEKLPDRFDCFSTYALNGFPGDVDDYYTLDPFFAADAALLDDYSSALLDRYRINGSLYGLPFDLKPLLIYYNAEYFDEQGLTPPRDDWTFEDFLSLAAAATSDSDGSHVYGFVSTNDSAINFLLSSRFSLPYDLSTNPPSANFDHPDATSAVDWLIDLSDAGIIPPPDEGGTRSIYGKLDSHFNLVESGRAAMWIDSASPRQTGSTISAEGLPFEVGVAPMPQGAHLLGGYSVSGFLISRRAEDPSACWEWIKFLTAQPSAISGMPARRSLIESGEWEARFGADRAAAIEKTIAWPPERIYTLSAFDEYGLLQGKPPIVAWLQDAIIGVLEGADAEASLATAQQKADDYVTCRATANADRESIIACAQRADPNYKPPN